MGDILNCCEHDKEAFVGRMVRWCFRKFYGLTIRDRSGSVDFTVFSVAWKLLVKWLQVAVKKSIPLDLAVIEDGVAGEIDSQALCVP